MAFIFEPSFFSERHLTSNEVNMFESRGGQKHFHVLFRELHEPFVGACLLWEASSIFGQLCGVEDSGIPSEGCIQHGG